MAETRSSYLRSLGATLLICLLSRFAADFVTDIGNAWLIGFVGGGIAAAVRELYGEGVGKL